MVQQRIFSSANGAPFVFSLTDAARDSCCAKAPT